MIRQEGFQLIDLAVACLLVSLLAAAGIPQLTAVLQSHRLQSATFLLATQLSVARSRAVTWNMPISVRVDAAGGRLGLAAGDSSPDLWRKLPGQVRIISSPVRDVTFYARGNAVPAGSYVIENSSGQTRVVVSITGRVRWERMGSP